MLLCPQDEKQLAETIATAAAERMPLEIVAGASKCGYGRPMALQSQLDVSQICGIIHYEPAELILTLRPGTRLAEVQSTLKAHRQMLAFEPPAWNALYEHDAMPTIGGIMACNLSGPRRLRAGAARDYLLGFSAVNGRGDVFKAGGKVVKNVTGFDVSKLITGSFGTLSVLSELTLKVMPKPETECTLLLHKLADDVALRTMFAVLNTPHEISSLAHLPNDAARRSSLPAVADAAGAITALRLEGPAPSVDERARAIAASFGIAARLEAIDSEIFWTEIAEVQPLLPPGHKILWRLCPTPTQAVELTRRIKTHFVSAKNYYDWGGGLIWLSLDAEEAGIDGGAKMIRTAISQYGGHATLIRAPDSIRSTIDVFEPLAHGLAQLTESVKSCFDPLNILNPGRMRASR